AASSVGDERRATGRLEGHNGMNDEIFAQFTASAGNGGVATAGSNGGAVSTGAINSGGNVGNAIAVGNTNSDPQIDGGDVSNNTSLGIAANGGTSIADASGGSYNLAFVS
ncbi:MAG TPA: hypothetical protein VFI22_09340, partial [Thermomicrobiales bacterium]|nr:hypothetical protein [Thermomicrobiales bacterium]